MRVFKPTIFPIRSATINVWDIPTYITFSRVLFHRLTGEEWVSLFKPLSILFQTVGAAVVLQLKVAPPLVWNN